MSDPYPIVTPVPYNPDEQPTDPAPYAEAEVFCTCPGGVLPAHNVNPTCPLHGVEARL